MYYNLILLLFFIIVIYISIKFNICAISIPMMVSGGGNLNINRIGYAYIDKNLLTSIQQHGYLSINNQLSMNIIGISDVKRKYKKQHTAAIKNYPDCPKDIVKYLDWREPNTEQGSKAIYYLFAPIPEDTAILDGIKNTRQDFLKNKILIQFPIVDIEYTINGSLDPSAYRQKSPNYWIEKWRSELAYDKGQQLWFDRIPHGMVVPKSGKILNIKVV